MIKSITFIVVYVVIMYTISLGTEKYAEHKIQNKTKERFNKTDWKDLSTKEREISEAAQTIIETALNFFFGVVLLIIMANIMW